MKRFLPLFLSTLLVGFLLIVLSQPDKALMQDLGRHIKMGEIIWECKCIPGTNLLSFTNPDFPFVNHHWLSEVVFYALYVSGGFGLILATKIMVITASFLLVLWLAFKKAHSFWVFGFAILYVLLFSERFDSRPEVFSFLFLSIYLFLIDLYKTNKKFWILLPLLFIQMLWNNMHIYFLVGIGLFGFLCIDQLVQFRKKVDKRLFFLLGGLLLTLFINPQGWQGALYPLHIFDNYGYSIVENQNIFFLNTFFFNYRILIFEILAVLALFGLVVNLRKLDVFYTLATLFALVASVMMIRNFPLFVLISFPYICFLYSRFFERFSTPTIAQAKVVVIGISSLVLLFATIKLLFLPQPAFSYVREFEKSVAFTKEQVKGPLFNNFDVGSFLTFYLYPEEKVFVDGRPEAYPASFFDNYKKMQTDPRVFEQEAEKYGINAIYFSHTDMTPWAQQFLTWIGQSKTWVPVYWDNYAVVLVKNTPENHPVIEKFVLNPLR